MMRHEKGDWREGVDLRTNRGDKAEFMSTKSTRAPTQKHRGGLHIHCFTALSFVTALSSVDASKHSSGPKVALMTRQYDHVETGPGTFVNYLEAQNETLELTFFSQDIASPDSRHRRVEFTSFRGWPGGQFIRSYAYHRAVSKVHAERPFDLIWYNTSPKTGFFSVLDALNVPVVLMINDYNNAISRYPLESRKELGIWSSIKRPIWRIFEKWTLRAADAVVVNSRFMKRVLGRWYGLPGRKMFRLYKAVDTDAFPFEPDRSFQPPWRVLFIKRDYKRGGLEELIDALSRLSVQTSLTIAGPAKGQASNIQSLIRAHRYEGDVDFLGRVSRERVRDLFQSHDLFCVPSRAEALGVVFLEALASGIPVVGTRVGGIPEVLDGGEAGGLVSARDVNELCRALKEVIRNPELRERRQHHGRRHAESFSVDRMVRRMEEIIREVLE